MELTELRDKLERWTFPLGPFVSIQDVYDEMAQEAQKLGLSSANELVEALITLDAEGDSLLEQLGELLEMYSRYYPDALAEALLEQLRPSGPPLLVNLLGCTGSDKAVTQLKKTLNLNIASNDLLEALAGTLGDLGGSEALEILYSLHNQKNLSKQVQEEINIALSNILPKPE